MFRFVRKMNDDVSDYVDVKHMEISGKFRVTSSRQRAIAFKMTKAQAKIKITLRRGPPRTSSREAACDPRNRCGREDYIVVNSAGIYMRNARNKTLMRRIWMRWCESKSGSFRSNLRFGTSLSFSLGCKRKFRYISYALINIMLKFDSMFCYKKQIYFED